MKYISLLKKCKAVAMGLCVAVLCASAMPMQASASEMDAIMLQKYYEEQQALAEARAIREAEEAQIAASYTMEKKSTSTKRVSNFGYWCYRPTESKDEALPMIVYLHGTDGKGSNLDTLLKIESLPSYINNGDIYPNAIVISPQCPSSYNWTSLADDVMELINIVVEEENVDISRISLTGCSLGGCGTYNIAIKNPNFFSAVVPVCGSINAASCKVLTNVPVKIFHGSLDYGMGFSSVTAAKVIQDNGGNCELIMLEGEGHEIRHVYKDEEYDLLNWMISQQRTDK